MQTTYAFTMFLYMVGAFSLAAFLAVMGSVIYRLAADILSAIDGQRWGDMS